MSQRASLVLLGVVAGAFALGLAWLFHVRLSGGDIYPPYSTLRADPLGTRAFYEALEEQPDLVVHRWLKPLVTLPPDAGTVILAGMDRTAWTEMTEQDAQALDAAAIGGARVVIIFAAEREPEVPRTQSKFEIAQKAKREKEKTKRLADLPARLKPVVWKTRWDVEPARRLILDNDLGAKRRPEAPGVLPLLVPWKSDVYFNVPSGGVWTVLYTRGSSPVVIERLRGRGSIVLATDPYFLSNEAMTERRLPALLSWLIGPHHSVTFVESQLGLTEEVGVATLARRYGLAGCFFVLVIAFALWVWKRMALFVPPSPVEAQLTLSYQQTAGLEALLRRAVPSKQLVSTCLDEWKNSARPSEAARLESALAGVAAEATTVERYNAAVRALKKRA